MNIRKWSAFLLIVPLLLAGCNTGAASPVTPAPSETPAPAPTLAPVSASSAGPETEAVPGPASSQLAGLLPAFEGFAWAYHGFHEYAHTMTLDTVRNLSGGVVFYSVSGWVNTPPYWEAVTDPSIMLSYTIGSDRIVQEKNAPGMLDSRFDRLELIRTPLVPGTSWEQTAIDQYNREITLSCTITDVEERTSGTVYTVTYQDTESEYCETRWIQEGAGVIQFDKLITLEGYDTLPVGYSLYTPGDMVNAELLPYLPPLDTDMTYAGTGGYAFSGKLAQSWEDSQESAYTFDGSYPDGASFQVRYHIDFNRGTVTEEILSNARTGLSEINSKVHNLVVLVLPQHLPMEKGYTWTHDAAIDGNPCTVQAEVVICDTEAGVIKIRYTAQNIPGYYNGTYVEERRFERGLGMTLFRQLLPGEIVPAEGETMEEAVNRHMLTYSLDEKSTLQ